MFGYTTSLRQQVFSRQSYRDMYYSIQLPQGVIDMPCEIIAKVNVIITFTNSEYSKNRSLILLNYVL